MGNVLDVATCMAHPDKCSDNVIDGVHLDPMIPAGPNSNTIIPSAVATPPSTTTTLLATTVP